MMKVIFESGNMNVLDSESGIRCSFESVSRGVNYLKEQGMDVKIDDIITKEDNHE
jgi:hypothetical protein